MSAQQEKHVPQINLRQNLLAALLITVHRHGLLPSASFMTLQLFCVTQLNRLKCAAAAAANMSTVNHTDVTDVCRQLVCHYGHNKQL